MWTEKQIDEFKETSTLLFEVLQSAFGFIRSHRDTTEYDVSQFILEQFEKFGLRSDIDPPIVAFRENTSLVHYFPEKKTAKKLKNNSLILIDLWAAKKEKGSPFSDITWMTYFGEAVPEKQQTAFSKVVESRDLALKYIQEQLNSGLLATGQQIDDVVRDVFQEDSLLDKFLHTTGHSIGTTSPHGRFGHLKQTNKNSIKENLGYALEPGLYFNNDFGIRSEINFYIKNKKLIVKTPIQNEIFLI